MRRIVSNSARQSALCQGHFAFYSFRVACALVCLCMSKWRVYRQTPLSSPAAEQTLLCFIGPEHQASVCVCALSHFSAAPD